MSARTEAGSPRTDQAAAGRIGPDDPRYADLAHRGFNRRFRGNPDYVRLVGSTEQVVQAVQEAVREDLRVAVRSGGHCLEGLVADPAVRVLIDTSLMTGVAYDPEMSAFVVEAGTTLGELYRKLFLGWGVTVPAGESPDIGVGGHVLGGAFGFLCREHGLAADHLYAVEVVTVDEAGTARSVVATREPSDPNRELWWAHTGGGGGNFGIVTRYWFRSPGARGTDPASLLPPAPASIRTFRVGWSWDELDERAFARLLRNHGEWCERNAGADAPGAKLFSILFLNRRQTGKVELRGLSTAGPDAERLCHEHLDALNQGVGAACTRQLETSTWLRFALNPFPELFRAPGAENASFKMKDAFLRRRFTDRQIEVAHHFLTRTDVDVPGGMLGLATYGGKVNTVAPDATASAQRDSILTTSCNAGWMDPSEAERNLGWVRAFYRELFADTGGVPAPGEASDGAFINHPDADLADPRWNTSGVPWHTLYYKDNYPRLQRVKARWDPRDVFRHALSVRLP
ncbi:FAD-binding oxidoreductase [Anaeromyxobacter sp. SG66]|uniref:FAD-binding oxidoreductase n=1 Tax=Anaeromyxobacter sp. SG66 TaxID=2925410 RepID=UPI001F5897AE|nr:FAD-binding oxidoreductase [Anaeromyxobacter sp. SG66]